MLTAWPAPSPQTHMGNRSQQISSGQSYVRRGGSKPTDLVRYSIFTSLTISSHQEKTHFIMSLVAGNIILWLLSLSVISVILLSSDNSQSMGNVILASARSRLSSAQVCDTRQQPIVSQVCTLCTVCTVTAWPGVYTRCTGHSQPLGGARQWATTLTQHLM